jgi:hypothetical protein
VTEYEWKKQWNMSTEADEDNECVQSGFYDRRINPTLISILPCQYVKMRLRLRLRLRIDR